MRACKVYIHGRYAGVLKEVGLQGYDFIYDESYRKDPSTSALCLGMPKNQDIYHSEVLFPFFFNLLSEGENRKFQSMYLKIDPQDDFGFLLATAQYDTAGAVTVEPINE